MWIATSQLHREVFINTSVLAHLSSLCTVLYYVFIIGPCMKACNVAHNVGNKMWEGDVLSGAP